MRWAHSGAPLAGADEGPLAPADRPAVPTLLVPKALPPSDDPVARTAPATALVPARMPMAPATPRPPAASAVPTAAPAPSCGAPAARPVAIPGPKMPRP